MNFIKDKLGLLLVAVICAVVAHVFFYVSGECAFYILFILFSAGFLMDYIGKRIKKK